LVLKRHELGFPKAEKLREKSDIDRLFRTGARFSCKGMALRIAKNALGKNRAVFVPVRSFRGSVERNRAKRVAREVWRLNKASVVQGYDLAFVLYPDTVGFEEVRSNMLFLLRKAGLFR